MILPVSNAESWVLQALASILVYTIHIFADMMLAVIQAVNCNDPEKLNGLTVERIFIFGDKKCSTYVEPYRPLSFRKHCEYTLQSKSGSVCFHSQAVHAGLPC